MKRRGLLLCAAAVAVALSVSCGAAGPSAPKLVLLVTVDQLRYDYLTRFESLYEGGFKTLLDKGAVFTNAKYRHAVTVTGAGHATIGTGMHPSHTGVVGNNWYDGATLKDVNCVEDDDAPLVGSPGRGTSPRTMLADTVGDMLKEKHAGSKVVGVSWKDRSAILPAGRKADIAVWRVSGCTCFVTSEYYAKETPQWLADFNAAHPLEALVGKSWTRLKDDPALYEKMAREDEFPTEGDGVNTTFPHVFPDQVGGDLEDAIDNTPFSDELTLEAALAALDAYQLGDDGETDVLAVSFSATDLVGHSYGPFSQEAMDQHLRLDLLLGRLFAAVDAKVGLDNVVIALSADHGALPMPEELTKRGVDSKRISVRALADEVDQAVAKKFAALSKSIVALNGSNMYLDLPAIEKAGVSRADVEAVARETLLANETVVAVYTHDDLAGDAASDDPFIQLYRNALFERRSPHLFVRLKEFYYPGGARGTGHGAPYDYDRHIPVILMGQGVQAGSYDAEAGPEDIAPTLERLTGLEARLEADTRVLTEALQPH